MGRKALTEQTYLALLDAFRTDPDHPYSVAKVVGVDPRTAVKAWKVGFPHKGWDPIEVTLEREKQLRRRELMVRTAAQRAEAEKQREDAVKSAAASKTQEAQMVGLARTGALQALTVASNLAAAARELAALVRKKIIDESKQPDQIPDPNNPGQMIPNPAQISAGHGLAMLSRVADIQAKVVALSMEAMHMERLHLGEPNAVLNVIHNQSDMTVEELEVRVAMATEALRRAQQYGGLKLVPKVDEGAALIGRRVGA